MSSNNNIYKIRNKATGQFVATGSYQQFNDTGAAWRRIDHVINYLHSMFRYNAKSNSYDESQLELVEYETVEKKVIPIQQLYIGLDKL